MPNEFFPIDEKFLMAIMHLDDRNDADWQIIKEHICSISKSIDQRNLHGFPDTRMNYDARFHTLRGIGIAMDLIQNVFNHPEELQQELREQEEFNKAKEQVEKEEGIF